MIIQKFLILPAQNKYLYIEALFWIGSYSLGIKFLPFRIFTPSLGLYMEESPADIDEDEIRVARSVGDAVNAISNNCAWTSKCLVSAITAKKMLRRRGIKSTLYLGAGFDEDSQMIAHAWLRCGDLFLTGGDERHGFAVTGKFADV